MKEKLDRAYRAGIEEGQRAASEFAEMQGQIKGATETWDLMEKMFTEIDGIGEKTKEKILLRVQEYAKDEKNKLIGRGHAGF